MNKEKTNSYSNRVFFKELTDEKYSVLLKTL